MKAFVRSARDIFAKKTKDRQYNRIYERFRPFTMLSPSAYINTLRLAGECREIEGCVVECGVWKGGVAAGLVTDLGTHREYFLFDSFEGLPCAREIDGAAAIEWQANKEGPNYFDNCSAPEHFAERAMKLSGSENYHLIKGWFAQTLATSMPSKPIAFLHLDADWYESTMTCLQQLFDHVAVGGLIILDDY